MGPSEHLLGSIRVQFGPSGLFVDSYWVLVQSIWVLVDSLFVLGTAIGS